MGTYFSKSSNKTQARVNIKKEPPHSFEEIENRLCYYQLNILLALKDIQKQKKCDLLTSLIEKHLDFLDEKGILTEYERYDIRKYYLDEEVVTHL